MTFDEAIDAFANATLLPVDEVDWVLANWAETGPQCRKLLSGYIAGDDLSERTQRALFVVLHLFGEKRDTAAFANICFILDDCETTDLLLGDASDSLVAPLLISTFDGQTSLLHRVIAAEEADDAVRSDALMALCYLTRTGKIPETETYAFMARLPDGLHAEPSFVWLTWVEAVSAMGFAGLAGRVEQAFKDGQIEPEIMTLEDFWLGLKESQADPKAMTSPAWAGLGPLDSAVDALLDLEEGDDPDDEPAPVLPAPIRNPLRDVGRNDPCPCGSGKKYKKCCGANV